MGKKKFVVARKDICAGQLLKPFKMSYKIYDEFNNEITEEDLAKRGITGFSISGGRICRGMLFNVNEQGLANDLIYTTPTNYPIEGIQPKHDIESDFIISHYVELEELLKYLNFPVELTQDDLNKIYKKLITHEWWLEHHQELFGWKKMSDGYCSGGIETLPMSVYNNLRQINSHKNGKPDIEEPGYSYIKKIKCFNK